MKEKDKKSKALEAMLCMTRQCWEQGMAAQTLLEIGEDVRLELFVYDMVLRQSSDGRLCNVENTPAVTDSAFCIPSVYIVGQLKKNPRYVEAARKNVEFLLKDAERAEDGTLFHMKGTKEIWADSAAFLPYALALTGHRKEGFAQMQGILKRLYRPSIGLYYHMWDDGKGDFLRPVAWGVGNGWILTGLFRMLLVFREESEERKWLKGKFLDLLHGMLKVQAPSGLFHNFLDKEDTYEESEVSAMVAYILYWAVKEGMLGREYLKSAETIREALIQKVDEKGLMWDAASSPAFEDPGTSVEGQAHFILMEEARKNCTYFLGRDV